MEKLAQLHIAAMAFGTHALFLDMAFSHERQQNFPAARILQEKGLDT